MAVGDAAAAERDFVGPAVKDLQKGAAGEAEIDRPDAAVLPVHPERLFGVKHFLIEAGGLERVAGADRRMSKTADLHYGLQNVMFSIIWPTGVGAFP